VPDVQRAQGRGLEALTAGVVVTTALRIVRERPRRVIGIAAAVFGTTALISAIVEVKVVEAGAPIEIDALAAVLAAIVSAFGIVFYAGLLDLVASSIHEGTPDPPLADVLRRLPLTRLLIADLLLVLASGIAALAFVIPGLVVFTFFGLVGPLVVTEEHGIWAAFRRSAHLVRPHFWMALVLVTIPFLIEDQLLHGIDIDAFDHPFVGAFVVSALLGATVGAAVGLLEVALAHELRARDPLRPEPVDQ
jgi:hypothetical protein